MNFEHELEFFSDVLKKCHIHTAVISPSDSAEALIEPYFAGIIGFKSNSNVGQMLGFVESKTQYKLSDEFKLQYIYLRLPMPSEKNILLIGPYLSVPPDSKDILEIGERIGISEVAQKPLREYYDSIPVIPDGDRIFVMIDSFCERVWETPSFAIAESNINHGPAALRLDGSTSRGESFDEIEANIKMVEMRYSFENELIRAVSLGQQHKGMQLAFNINEKFEMRTSDSLRNAKNYCIIMNTLLRKAAENGGVHPVYIDSESSKFAVKIEQLSDMKNCPDIMREMFSSYCRLVYKHSTRSYSPIVQKTVLIIDSDISAELSLSILAKKQGISGGYLASIFKRDTGKTVSEYIKDRRISHAKYLLGTTQLQIQTVAWHCGIMDVQYFSKIFKRKTGKNPKEYRDAMKKAAK